MSTRHAAESAATAPTVTKRTKRARLGMAALAVAVLPFAGLATATSASAATTSTWDKVAQCESSGDWSANTGNGFYGGLQFTPSTWAEFGGTQYAPSADQATRAQQIDIAENVLAVQGPGAWPVCSGVAGLTSGGTAANVDTSSSATTASGSSSTSAGTGSSSSKSSTSSSTGTASDGSYTVQSGDTLGGIAAANGTSTEALYAANAQVVGSDPNLIYPGQVLAV
ncbi:LysM peptidoglycan-binding domain-containing protein [Kitasatospora sp. NPDC004289]